MAGDNILRAEDIGYSSDVCGYVKNDIGLYLNERQSPFGQLPEPDLLVCNFSGCNTFIKWFEALADLYDVPMYMIDVPYQRTPEQRPEDVAYVAAQLQELADFCEEMTGKAFDMGRLKEILGHSRRAEERWADVLHLARHRPSPFDAYFEAVFFMAPINILRGTPECAEYYDAVYKESEERIEHGLGPVPEERFRVVTEGPPPWPHFRTFWELFKKWGVTSVASTYAKVGGLWDARAVYHDPARPWESIADYTMNCYTNWNLGMRAGLLHQYMDEYDADALVIHSVKSCRSFSVGQADFREEFTKELGVPTLLVESDLADPRYFSESQLRNRIDAFFESLEHQRIVQGGS